MVLGNNSIKGRKKHQVAAAECHQSEKVLQKSEVWMIQSYTRPPEGSEKKRPPKSNMVALDVFLTSVHSIWKSESFPAIGGLCGHFE
ncbi:hypothetical protein ABVT39_006592, partial [Epinephelus coioides]